MGVAPALLLVISLTSFFIDHQFHNLDQSLHERGKTIAKQLAIASIYGVFSANKLMLQEMSNDLLKDRDVVFVSIKSIHGEVLAHSSNILETDSDNLQIFEAPVKIQSLRQNSTAVDFNTFEFNEKENDKKIGTVMVGLGLEQIQAARHQFLNNSLTIIVSCFAFALLLAFRLSKMISAPLIELTEVANDLANGNMDARAGQTSTTEIATLCDSFNAMAIGLQQTQNYLIQQVNNAVKELTVTMQVLEDKNQSLQKTTQLAVSQNETKSQFLAHISHEIRTPMNGIIGFIDLLTQSSLSPRQLEQAQLIKTSASNLLTIVNEILDYSSLETGNFKTENVNFNLRECIENSITAIVPRSQTVQLIIDIAPSLPVLICSDPIRIRQVLTNLVGNACKYTKHGHIIIRCILTKQSRLFVSVTDTGIGIAPEVIKDLFHPFLQISEYAVNDELGTGLGLTIAKNIIERLGGRIGVNSQLGKGSVFWFDIPVLTVDDPISFSRDTMVTIIDPLTLRRNALAKQVCHLGYISRCFTSIKHYQPQTEKSQEIIFYAVNSSFAAEEDFSAELAKIKPLARDKNIIFISHQLQNIHTIETLALPCRSTFLQQVIENSALQKQKAIPAVEISSTCKTARNFPIFIADDNEINRLLLKSQLENRSDDITLAEDGKQALPLLRQKKYQLILLDLQMPYFNGLELLEHIKQPDCINHNTPIIAITAHAQSHQRKKLIDAGFDECLIKPVLMEQLEEVLNVWQPLANNSFGKPIQKNEYLEQMLEKTSRNHELTTVLFNKLFIELPEQIASIQQAINQANWQLARETTHKLHGSVGFCGFTDLKDAVNQLEKDLINQESEAARTSFAVLHERTDHFLSLKNVILQDLRNI